MTPYNVNSKAPFENFLPNGSLDSTGENWFRTESVQASPLVKGDHKKPNSFEYSVDLQAYAMGTEKFPWGRREGALGYTVGQLTLRASEDEKSLLLAKALGRLNDAARGSLDLSVSLAEAHQVKRMIGSMHKVESYMVPFKKMPKKTQLLVKAGESLKSVLQSMGKNWLQWQYGWRPLIQDAWGIADNLLRNPQSGLIKLKGKAQLKYGNQKLPILYYGDDVRLDAEVTGKCGFAYHVICEPVKLENPISWASMNPASIAWELLPYSFVADWFYDVGGYLRALETSYLNSTNFNSGYLTFLDYQAGGIDVTDVMLKNDGSHILTMRSGYKYIKFKRTVLTTWPFPRAPTFKVDLGVDRLLSSASLLSLNLGGARKPK